MKYLNKAIYDISAIEQASSVICSQPNNTKRKISEALLRTYKHTHRVEESNTPSISPANSKNVIIINGR